MTNKKPFSNATFTFPDFSVRYGTVDMRKSNKFGQYKCFVRQDGVEDARLDVMYLSDAYFSLTR